MIAVPVAGYLRDCSNEAASLMHVWHMAIQFSLPCVVPAGDMFLAKFELQDDGKGS